jgi:hypothetical protein
MPSVAKAKSLKRSNGFGMREPPITGLLLTDHGQKRPYSAAEDARTYRKRHDSDTEF